MLTMLAISAAMAADSEQTWAVSVGGAEVGTQSAKVRIIPDASGTRRIIESYTDLSAKVGPVTLKLRQRLTANAVGSSPASFHSVVDDNGTGAEIQGRYSTGGWVVTSNHGGRARTVEYPQNKIDFSTADLLDPEARLGLANKSTVRILNTYTGQVMEGAISAAGNDVLKIGGAKVPVEKFAWASPEGKATFDFSAEGYLVRYEMPMAGLSVLGVLTSPPPGGVDDFPVGVGRPKVDILPL